MAEVDRKKSFPFLEKDLFIKILRKYEGILSCKKNNTSSAMAKKKCWEKILKEFNDSSIVTHKASTKQLVKLWYNMKAKARDLKTKENGEFMTGGSPAITESDEADSKALDIDKKVLTNIVVDVDSNISSITGDENEKTREKVVKVEIEEEECDQTNSTCSCSNNNYNIDVPSNRPQNMKRFREKKYIIERLKIDILEEELKFKKSVHEKELILKDLEILYKEMEIKKIKKELDQTYK